MVKTGLSDEGMGGDGSNHWSYASGRSLCQAVTKVGGEQPFLLRSPDTESFIPGRRASKCTFPLDLLRLLPGHQCQLPRKLTLPLKEWQNRDPCILGIFFFLIAGLEPRASHSRSVF